MSSTTLLRNLVAQETVLQDWQSRFPTEIDAIAELRRDFATRLAQIEAEGQHLIIGIMGQVKAGKSSFLNALLFDGKPVLPEAATPKTANLTFITWGPKYAFTANFYTPDEWAEIEEMGADTGDHAEAHTAREILAFAHQRELDVPSLLAKGVQRFEQDSLEALTGLLNDYVGENGRYTALVKDTRLELPLDELRQYDVVDTPGMNDPVQSRTHKTREYMARCHVVFFLSPCRSFFDKSDVDLLLHHLPAKGVRRMVLVGSQYDQAVARVIGGMGQKRAGVAASLAQVERDLAVKLVANVANRIEALAEVQDSLGRTENARCLRTLKEPIMASSFAHGYAHWPRERWSDEMVFNHDKLVNLVHKRCDGYRFTQMDWDRLGNFGRLTAAYKAVREERLAILRETRENLVPNTLNQYRERLQALADAVDSRAEKLRKGEASELERRQEGQVAQIKRIGTRLAEVLGATRDEARRASRDLSAELRERITGFARLQTRTGTEYEKRSREVSASTWYKPWTWGETTPVYYTVATNYEYLATADAIEQVIDYGRESAARLQRTFNDLVSMVDLRLKLKQALLAELDTDSPGFDANEFRTTFEGTLRRLELPELDLDLGDPGTEIGACFSREVRSGDEMAKLRQALKASLAGLFARLSAEFEHKVAALCERLDNTGARLGNELARDLRAELEHLRAAFEDKKRELESYDELLSHIAVARARLVGKEAADMGVSV